MDIQSEIDYEDMLALWFDLESGLSVILGSPDNSQEFANRVVQYDRWMQSLMQHDVDGSLYLLFQMAGNSPVGYSASHALICAVLAHMVCAELSITGAERDSLVRAALTMNLGMTALQDTLAAQAEPPSPEQREFVRKHSELSAQKLSLLGVRDSLWLDIVVQHHFEFAVQDDIYTLPAVGRLARILKAIDRFAAMISPRRSRQGRTAVESARTMMISGAAKFNAIGHALVRAVGVYPPGTFVRLTSGELAVVLRRTGPNGYPDVAIVSTPGGDPIATPRLHQTKHKPQIHAALAASMVRARLNHYQLLRLSATPT